MVANMFFVWAKASGTGLAVTAGMDKALLTYYRPESLVTSSATQDEPKKTPNTFKHLNADSDSPGKS